MQLTTDCKITMADRRITELFIPIAGLSRPSSRAGIPSSAAQSPTRTAMSARDIQQLSQDLLATQAQVEWLGGELQALKGSGAKGTVQTQEVSIAMQRAHVVLSALAPAAIH